MSSRIKIMIRLVGLVLLLIALFLANAVIGADLSEAERALFGFWTVVLLLAGLLLLVPKLV